MKAAAEDTTVEQPPDDEAFVCVGELNDWHAPTFTKELKPMKRDGELFHRRVCPACKTIMWRSAGESKIRRAKNKLLSRLNRHF